MLDVLKTELREVPGEDAGREGQVEPEAVGEGSEVVTAGVAVRVEAVKRVGDVAGGKGAADL